LVSDTGFLSSAVMGSATYTSLTLTFANPQVTIVNNSGTSIVTPAQTCCERRGLYVQRQAELGIVDDLKWCLSDYPYSEQQYWLALDLSIPDLFTKRSFHNAG